MAIAKMALVTIDGHIAALDNALLQCARSGNFDPETPVNSGRQDGFTAFSQANPYEELLKQITEVSMRAGLDIHQMESDTLRNMRLGRIDDLKEKIEEIKKKRPLLKKLIEENEGVPVEESRVFSSTYVRFRIGRIPALTRKRIESSFTDGWVALTFPKDKHYDWCAYLTTESRAQDADDFFAALDFERILVPEDLLYSSDALLQYEHNMNEPFHVNVKGVSHYVDKINRQLTKMIRKKNGMQTQRAENEQILEQISHIEGHDITFDALFASEFIDIRFGKLPRDSFSKLPYYEDQLFLFEVLSEDESYYWGVYFTPTACKAEVDAIFDSLYYERIRIPDYVHKTPEETRALFLRAVELEQKKLEEVERELERLVHKVRLYFYWLYARVLYLRDTFNLRRYVSVNSDIFHLVGFVPEESVKVFKEEMNASSAHYLAFQPGKDEENSSSIADREEEVEPGQISVLPRPSDSEPRLTPPTKLKNRWFARPFEMFTEMYGLPEYHDVDPTPLVAITYTLFFGIMFGDFGQGLVLWLLGFIMTKRGKKGIFPVLERIGIASAAFGFIYGEFFGNEEVLNPIFNALGMQAFPYRSLVDPMLILAAGVFLGMGLILFCMVINIITGIRQKEWERAIFSQNGVAGFLFYGSIVLSALTAFGLGKSVIPMVVLLPLLIIVFLAMYFKGALAQLVSGKKVTFEDGIGTYLVENFFEMFEVLLSYLSNTLSFIRVGGFVLSHAGMMLVVTALADMTSGVGYLIVMILGNAFVMGLEGLIVGIQGLRLEFYELFSRFMGGTGEAFTPIQIGEKSK